MSSLEPLDFYRSLNLKLATAFEKAPEGHNLLQIQLQALMETFRADVGGILLRPDMEKPDAKLVYFSDLNRRLPKDLQLGGVFQNAKDIHPYLRDYWKLHGNTAFSPTADVGVDAWIPIHSPQQTRGAFFIDDTSQALDISNLMTDLTRVSLNFSMQYELIMRSKEQRRSVANMLGLQVIEGGAEMRDPQVAGEFKNTGSH